jgi:hypothetical protein
VIIGKRVVEKNGSWPRRVIKIVVCKMPHLKMLTGKIVAGKMAI